MRSGRAARNDTFVFLPVPSTTGYSIGRTSLYLNTRVYARQVRLPRSKLPQKLPLDPGTSDEYTEYSREHRRSGGFLARGPGSQARRKRVY